MEVHEARVLARVLPSVCSVQSLERPASQEVLLLFNTAPVVNILTVEIVIGDSSLFKHQLLTYLNRSIHAKYSLSLLYKNFEKNHTG